MNITVQKSLKQRVHDIFVDCLYTMNEVGVMRSKNSKSVMGVGPPENSVFVVGLTGAYAFHPARLESHRAEVADLIREIVHPAFMRAEHPPEDPVGAGDGGWSFLNLAESKNGEQWGEHRDMERFLVLSLGLGFANYCAPQQFWHLLPGGVPYVWFTLPRDIIMKEG
jgi:hypothetical protein